MEHFNISHSDNHLRKKLRHNQGDLEMLKIVKKMKVVGFLRKFWQFFDGNFPK